MHLKILLIIIAPLKNVMQLWVYLLEMNYVVNLWSYICMLVGIAKARVGFDLGNSVFFSKSYFRGHCLTRAELRWGARKGRGAAAMVCTGLTLPSHRAIASIRRGGSPNVGNIRAWQAGWQAPAPSWQGSRSWELLHVVKRANKETKPHRQMGPCPCPSPSPWPWHVSLFFFFVGLLAWSEISLQYIRQHRTTSPGACGMTYRISYFPCSKEGAKRALCSPHAWRCWGAVAFHLAIIFSIYGSLIRS